MHSVLSPTKKPHVTELAQMKWLHDGLSCHNVKFQWEKKVKLYWQRNKVNALTQLIITRLIYYNTYNEIIS